MFGELSIIDNQFIDKILYTVLKSFQYSSFSEVEHFSPWEVGDASKMNLRFMTKLDWFRKVADRKVIIHEAYSTSGHKEESFHYKGLAADLHVEGYTLQEMFRLAYLFRFSGIGVYPFWNRPGLHLDERPYDGHIATWYRDKEGNYTELPEEYKRLTY